MKRNLILASLCLLSLNAFAKSGAQCKTELESEGKNYLNFSFLSDQKGGIPDLSDCKEIKGNFLTKDGQVQSVDQKVFITADKRNIIALDNQTRKVSLSVFDSTITDIVVMAGRLVMVSEDHRVLVVGRNGNKFELLTSGGTSYKQVKSVKMDKETLILEQEGGAPISLTEETLTKRLNTKNQFKSVAF